MILRAPWRPQSVRHVDSPTRSAGLFAMRLSLAILCCGCFADPVHEVVAAFHRPLTGPSQPVVMGADGFLWGYAGLGGSALIGIIYKIRPDGTSFTKVVNQIVDARMTLGPNGDLYAVTYGGGTNSHGSIIKINTAGVVTTVFSFYDFDPARKGRGAEFTAGAGHRWKFLWNHGHWRIGWWNDFQDFSQRDLHFAQSVRLRSARL